MLRRCIILSACALLWACAPLETNYKPGVSVSTLNRDQTQCDVRALREVPVSTQVRRLPPEYVPARRYCRKKDRCVTYPGYYLPGELVTYDANAGLRARVAQQCMADRGYARVSIPQCSATVAEAAPAGRMTRLPQLTDTSCFIRNSDGSIRIVQTAG